MPASFERSPSDAASCRSASRPEVREQLGVWAVEFAALAKATDRAPARSEPRYGEARSARVPARQHYFPSTPASNDTVREIAKAVRRHVDAATLEKVVSDLLDVPSDRSFRDAIEALARELMRR